MMILIRWLIIATVVQYVGGDLFASKDNSMETVYRSSDSHSNEKMEEIYILEKEMMKPLTRVMPQCDDDTGEGKHRYDPLACWLWNLNVSIPDQKFKETIFTVRIENMICTNFTMEAIDSSYRPSIANDTDPAIDISISGISATCLGEYKSTGMGGTVQASVDTLDDNAALALSLSFVSKMYDSRVRLADSVSTQNCVAHLHVPEEDGVKFSGSISARVINLFSSRIANYVSSALSTQLCPVLESTMDLTLTNLIQQADHYMTELLPNETLLEVEPERRRVSTEGWVDWTRDTPVLHSFLQLGNHMLDRYLDKGFLLDWLSKMGFGTDPLDDCGYFFRGLNGIIKSLTNGTGQVEFSIPTGLRNITIIVPTYAMVTVHINKVRVEGVDQLTGISLLEPLDSEDFLSTLRSTNGFNITADMDVEVSPIEDGMFQGETLEESFQLYIHTSQVDLAGYLTLGYDKIGFARIAMGDAISCLESALKLNFSASSCLLAPLQSLTLPGLMANVNLDAIVFAPDLKFTPVITNTSGELEKDIDRLLNNFLELFLQEYNVLVTESLAGFIDGPLRLQVNTLLEDTLTNISTQQENDTALCDMWPIPNDAKFFNFATFGWFDKFNHFLNDERTLSRTNEYITCTVDVLNRDFVTIPHSFEVDGTTIQLEQLTFRDFGALTEIEILSPEIDGYHVRNGLSIGTCNKDDMAEDTSSCKVPSAVAVFNVDSPILNLTSSINVAAFFNEAVVGAGSFLKFDVGALRNLSLASLLSNGYCAALPTAEVTMYDLNRTAGRIHVNISSILASSVFERTVVTFDSDQYEILSNLTQAMLAWIMTSTEELVNSFIGSVLPRAQSFCSGMDVPTEIDDKPDDPWVVWNVMAVLVMLFIVNAVTVVVRVLRQDSSQDTLSDDLSRPLLNPDEPRSEMSSDPPPKLAERKCLMLGDSIPDILRHSLPAGVIGTLVLLLSSNLSTGASVDVVVAFSDDQTLALPSLFAFSLGNTIREMYSAGIYALMLLVVVFSGVWPYLKLVMIFFAWIVPTSIMSTYQRGTLLFSLDALGKFSLVDTFVLVLMMVSFRFHLALDGAPTLDVYVNPSFGFYGFLLATSLSLLAGHIILFYHRREQHPLASLSNTKESLSNHEYDNYEDKGRRRMSGIFRVSVCVAIGLAALCLIIGSTKESFVFEFGGLAGKSLGSDRRKSYSLLSLGSSLPLSVEDPTSVGILCLQAAYFFYALVMPFTCLATLYVIFLKPMTIQYQQRAIMLAEIANAWSAIEVFVLSIIASLFEISTFAAFMIGNSCNLIDRVLAEYFDQEMAGDDTCYSVRSSVEANVWYLVFGVALNSLLVSVLLRFAHRAMEERIQRDFESIEMEDDPLACKGVPRDLVSALMGGKLGSYLFSSDLQNAGLESRQKRCDSRFWEEWRSICSFT